MAWRGVEPCRAPRRPCRRPAPAVPSRRPCKVHRRRLLHGDGPGVPASRRPAAPSNCENYRVDVANSPIYSQVSVEFLNLFLPAHSPTVATFERRFSTVSLAFFQSTSLGQQSAYRVVNMLTDILLFYVGCFICNFVCVYILLDYTLVLCTVMY